MFYDVFKKFHSGFYVRMKKNSNSEWRERRKVRPIAWQFNVKVDCEGNDKDKGFFFP